MTFLSLGTAPRAGFHPASAAAWLTVLRHEWTLVPARRSMSRLDDALLHDLGVARGDIDRAVRNGRRVMRTPIA